MRKTRRAEPGTADVEMTNHEHQHRTACHRHLPRNLLPHGVLVEELAGHIDIYSERAHLLAVLSRAYPSRAFTDHNGEQGFDFVVAVNLYNGGKWWCWHVSDRDKHLFDHVSYGPSVYDGHSTEDKYAAIAEYVKGDVYHHG